MLCFLFLSLSFRPALPCGLLSALEPGAALLWPVKGGPSWSPTPSSSRRCWGEEASSPGWDWPSTGLVKALTRHSRPLGPQERGWRLKRGGVTGSRGPGSAHTVLRHSDLSLRGLPPSGPLQGQALSSRAMLPAGKSQACFHGGHGHTKTGRAGGQEETQFATSARAGFPINCTE